MADPGNYAEHAATMKKIQGYPMTGARRRRESTCLDRVMGNHYPAPLFSCGSGGIGRRA